MQLEISPESKKTVAELSAMGTNVLQALSDGLFKGSKLAAGNVVWNYLSGQSLKRRTGALSRAVDGWLLKPLEAVVGVRENAAVAKYAWLLTDEEKTITPKRAKFLAIPIGEGLTKAGVARYASPRDVPKGFFVKSKTGHLLFGYKRGKRGKFRALFVLVKSVFIQGSGALYDGVYDSTDEMAGQIETEIGKVTGS